MPFLCRLGLHKWAIIRTPTGPRYLCTRCGRRR